MAHKVGPAKPPISDKTTKWGIGIGLAVMALAVVVPLILSQLSGCGRGGAPSGVSPAPKPSEAPVTGETIEPGEGKVRLQVGETRKIKLDPERWSPWLSLPPGVAFRIRSDGKIQYWYWSENRPQEWVQPGSTEWFGTVPDSIFRVRGEGEGTIWIGQ